MKKEKNELLMLLGGMAMLVAGLFILSQKVVVTSGFYYLFGFRMSTGLIMVPLIIGIIWLFASGGSFGAKLVTALGVAFIVISVILSVSIHLVSMTLFDYIILLILIFGGIGLMCRVLFKPGTSVELKDADEKKNKSIEEELEELKNNK